MPDLIETIRHAYAKQGLAAFEITERATTLHEAGHAVAGVAMFGEVPDSISLGTQFIKDRRGLGPVIDHGRQSAYFCSG